MTTPDRGAPNRPGIKACCQEVQNLEREEERRRGTALWVMDRCQVCQCRHWRVTIDLSTLLKGREP